MKKGAKAFTTFLLGAIWSLLLVPSAIASECYVPTVCEAFTRAEVVFTGKLLSVESFRKPGEQFYRGTFRVHTVFKGKAVTEETLEFSASLLETEFEVGETYFIYKERVGLFPRVCNRTTSLFTAVRELEYARSRSWERPSFRISGLIAGNHPLLERAKQKVRIYGQKGSTAVSVDQDGFYGFDTEVPGEYRVSIEVPFLASIFVNRLGELFQSEGRGVSYAVAYQPNECDFRKILFNQ